MNATSTGQQLVHDGNRMITYARDISAGETYGVWHHNGLRMYDEPAWGMDPDAEVKLSVSVDKILVSHGGTLYLVERDALRESEGYVDDTHNYIAKESDDFVTAIGSPSDHLNDSLVRSSDHAHGGYHRDKNES